MVDSITPHDVSILCDAYNTAYVVGMSMDGSVFKLSKGLDLNAVQNHNSKFFISLSLSLAIYKVMISLEYILPCQYKDLWQAFAMKQLVDRVLNIGSIMS